MKTISKLIEELETMRDAHKWLWPTDRLDSLEGSLAAAKLTLENLKKTFPISQQHRIYAKSYRGLSEKD